MTDAIDRRQFVAGIAALTATGVAGCTEASEDGTPPSTEDPQEGPSAEQNGNTEQEPGLGPAGGSAEQNQTGVPDERGDGGAAPDEPGQAGDEDGNGSNAGEGDAGEGGGGDDGGGDAG